MPMAIPWPVWMIFLAVLGAIVGSFLNVVVYRLPRGESLISPPSHCTACKKNIAWYDNIPIASWFILRGKCRHCGTKFSIRYAMVELATAILFAGLFWAYFIVRVRGAMPTFAHGGWLIYANHVALGCVLLVSSLIDRDHFIIELRVCYLAAIIGAVAAAVGPYIGAIPQHHCAGISLGVHNPATAMATIGAVLGLGISAMLLRCGLIHRSFEQWDRQVQQAAEAGKEIPTCPPGVVRGEMVREMAFLAAPAVGAMLGTVLAGRPDSTMAAWAGQIVAVPWLWGLLGSIFGFIIAAAVVWFTRIAGSMAFGKEAMGLGDVHLMAAAGAVLGWEMPVVAFFLAPFLGLGIAAARWLMRREHEIWYGPFLSLATLVVMIAYDALVVRFLIPWFTGNY